MQKENELFFVPLVGKTSACRQKEGLKLIKGLPLLPRLTAVLPPQGREMCSGFTLIELLIVVLIIGVLSAIALPQYQHAINKVRYVSMMEAVNAAKRSQELYYLTHGSYATSSKDLKADLPGNCSCSDQSCNCGHFALYLESAHNVYALPHKEPRTTYITYYDHASYNAGKRACGTEHSSQPERAKKLCRSVTGNDSEGYNFLF